MDLKNIENKECLIKSIEKLVGDYKSLLCAYADKEETYKRAALLYYWLRDYRNYISNEKAFSSKYLPCYRRGNIINVNFGFNLGSELGGLHYAVVLADSTQSNPTVVVAPMTSYKAGRKIRKDELFIDDRLFLQLKSKQDALIQSEKSMLKSLRNFPECNNAMKDQIKAIMKNIDQLEHIKHKISTLKHGSIIKMSQIRTISKMRIVDPTKPTDVFYNISLPSKDLNSVDERLVSLYTNPSKKQF